MSAFLTLVRREIADNRVGIVWLPAIIALLLLLSVGGSMLFGNVLFDGSSPGRILLDVSDETPAERARIAADIARAGPDAGVTVEGDTVIVDTARLSRSREALRNVPELDKVMSLAAVVLSAVASPVLLVAAFSAVFMLLGSLYDERIDRSILFWKSMPVSDLETVLSKLAACVVATFVVALGLGILLHVAFIGLGSLTAVRFGLGELLGMMRFDLVLWTWLTLATGVLVYILWALPVYGYLLLVSASAPKAPFVWAVLPVVGLAIVERTLGVRDGLTEEIGARLVGYYLGAKLDPTNTGFGWQFKGEDFERVAEAPLALASSLTHPGLWIGLLVTAGLVYAASEVRRRKAL